VPSGEASLVENEELHRRLLEMARRPEAAVYEHEDVIGDPHQTFGVEIEFDGADPQVVARRLYEAGLTASPYQEGYHSGRRQPGRWSLERDATVAGELVSPVLRDTAETWEQLERVCQILRECGARTSSRTGGHVHVGADEADLDHNLERLRRVARTCAWSEDLMYRLAAATGRGGASHRGVGNGFRWCGPMRDPGAIEQARNVNDLAHRVGASHGVGLNYGNLLSGTRTIEYRYFDSSLDPVRLQANIKLACWLSKRAGAMAEQDLPAGRHSLGSHQQRGGDRQDLLLRRFADLVFVRPRDKLKLY
jgi:Putative amidoligase enzyme